MTTHSKKSVIWVGALLLLLSCLFSAAMTWRKAEANADHPAHAALTDEIFGRLSAIPPGQAYPKSLSELPLTYPDGGDASFLSRFTYHSSVTSCTVRTSLRSQELVRSFP